MATARDIIKSALRKIAVLGAGSSLDPNEAQDALDLLNGMLASWSIEGNLVYTEDEETFNLVSGQSSYTIGSGGDFNTVRPTKINAASVSVGDTEISMYLIDQIQFSQITQNTITGTPDVLYYDAGYPLGTLRMFPVPTGETITLYTVKPLTSFATLDTAFAMPEEYRIALEYNLSEAIAPEYEREASMTVKRIAARTKRAVESQNNRNEKHLSTINVPAGKNQGTFNIYSGEY